MSDNNKNMLTAKWQRNSEFESPKMARNRGNATGKVCIGHVFVTISLDTK